MKNPKILAVIFEPKYYKKTGAFIGEQAIDKDYDKLWWGMVQQGSFILWRDNLTGKPVITSIDCAIHGYEILLPSTFLFETILMEAAIEKLGLKR